VEKFTWTVQLACGARDTPVQLSVPFEKDHPDSKSPPFTATPVTVTPVPVPAAEELVNVTVPLPGRRMPGAVIASGLGVMETVALVEVLVPLIVTGAPVTTAAFAYVIASDRV